MTSGRALLLVFLTITIVTNVIMRVWTMPAIRAGSGGLDMFDLLIDGYSPGYVGLYLDLLSEEARALYLGPQRVLDTVMPAALTGTLAVSAYLLAKRWSLVLALALGLVPLFYFAFDMLENATVAIILEHRAATDELAEAASRFTVSKAQALRFAVTAVLFVVSARAFETAVGWTPWRESK